jgi:hypothetical protein
MNNSSRGSIKKQKLSVVVILFVSAVFLFSGDVIQTQEADQWDDIEVDLNKITVKNNVVTVKFKFRNTGTEKQEITIRYKNCYIMDEANQKKYFVLKDSDEIYIAGPQYSQQYGGLFWFTIQPKKSKNMWLKFPEPTVIPKTIIISIPGIGLFEDVEIKK